MNARAWRPWPGRAGRRPRRSVTDLQRADLDLVLPAIRASNASCGDLGRGVLGPRPTRGLRHVRALEECRVGRSREERGDRDARLLELVSQGLAERQDERLRRRVGGVVGPGIRLAVDAVNMTRPCPALPCPAPGPCQPYGATTSSAITSRSPSSGVSRNEPPCPTPALSASASTGRPRRVDGVDEVWMPSGVVRSAWTARAAVRPASSSVATVWTRRPPRYHEVEAVLGEHRREGEPDAAGGSGDDGERVRGGAAGMETPGVGGCAACLALPRPYADPGGRARRAVISGSAGPSPGRWPCRA